jgi:hypothetical protein
MNDDLADGVLLDVRGIDIADLRISDDENALDLALSRLLASNVDTNYNSFGSSI